MSTPPSPEQILAGALASALEQLGIDEARFAALGIEQRRLALCEALFRIGKRVADDVRWLHEGFIFKPTLASYSPDHIDAHYKLLHALTGLVCLGQTAYLRPFVSYLSFPEPRWAMKVDAVLQAITRQPMRRPVYRIPQQRVLGRWRRWAVGLSPVPKVSDYSTSVLRYPSRVRLHWNAYMHNEDSDALWLLSTATSGPASAQYFDHRSAAICATQLYPDFRPATLRRFVDRLDDLLQTQPDARQAHYETIVASLRDHVADSKHSTRQLLTALFDDVDGSHLHPRCVVIMFRVFATQRDELPLAEHMVRWGFKDRAPADHWPALGDIVLKRIDSNSVIRVLDFKSTARFAPTEAVASGLDPLIHQMVALYVRSLVSSELWNLSLASGVPRPSRSTIRDTVNRQWDVHNRFIRSLTRFRDSEDPDCRRLAGWMSEFLRLRLEHKDEIDHSLEKGDAGNTLKKYRRLIDRYLKWGAAGLKSLRASN